MSLRVDIRERLGLTGGGALLIEETEDGVILRTIPQSIAQAQALAKKYTGESRAASIAGFKTVGGAYSSSRRRGA